MWELHTYGGADFLRLVFNGIAAIFGNDDYRTAVTVAVLLGFLSVLVSAAFRRGEMNLQWFLAVIMLYQVALVPKMDIQITDHVVPAESAIVGNIPLGIAAPATMISHFSHWLTTSMEVVFSMPNETRYTGNGLLFANELVKKSTEFHITDPRIASNFSNFWKKCVFYDIMLDRYPVESLIKSPDLMVFFGNNTSQVRTFAYKDPTGANQLLVCRAGITTEMANDMALEISNATDIYGARIIDNATTRNEAAIQFANVLPIAFEYMTNISTTNANIVSQNALANSFKRAMIEQAIDIDSAAAVQDLALAKAEQERKATFIVMGKLAHKFLPILQHLFEAIIYAFSPVVMLLALTPLVAKVATNYLRIVLWVNLWPPLYAVLHFAMSYYSARAGAAAVIDSGSTFNTGLNMMTHVELGQVMSEYSAIAGYLSVSIPMIAWLMVSASGAMMAGLAGRFLQGYETPVSSAAGEASSGNISLGNLNYENTRAFQSVSSPLLESGVASARSGSGSLVHYDERGATLEQRQASGNVSLEALESQKNSLQSSLEVSKSRAEESKYSLANSNMQVARDTEALMAQTSSSNSYSRTATNETGVGDTMSRSSLENNVRTWAESQGLELSNQQTTGIVAQIQAGFKAGGFGEISAGARHENSSTERMTDTQKMAVDFAASQNFSSTIAVNSKNALAEAAQNSDSSSESQVRSLTQSLDTQQQEQYAYSQAQMIVEKQSQALQKAEESATAIRVNGTQGLANTLVDGGRDIGEVNALLYEAALPGEKGQAARDTIGSVDDFSYFNAPKFELTPVEHGLKLTPSNLDKPDMTSLDFRPIQKEATQDKMNDVEQERQEKTERMTKGVIGSKAR